MLVRISPLLVTELLDFVVKLTLTLKLVMFDM